MTRLLVHVEGETEESFVNMILAPHLSELGYLSVSARLIGNARQRERRGGIRPWEAVRKEIFGHLRNDPGAAATTMIDYYGLPGGGPGAWPGRGCAGASSVTEKAAAVEEALCRDIAGRMGAGFDLSRFMCRCTSSKRCSSAITSDSVRE